MNPILLAVKHADSDAALRFAVLEARRRDCGVHVLHVARTHTGPRAHEAGRLVLSDVSTKLSRLAEGRELPVTTELAPAPVVPAILHAARQADLVVLQHRPVGDHAVHVGASTTATVAARSPVPVVAVDPDWTPSEQGDAVVTVGAKTPDSVDAVVLAAAEAAERANARLRIVHAGGRRYTARLPERFAHLHVDIVVSLWEPARALALHSEDSILLVVGRHASSSSHLHRLGKVARAVLGSSPVPVMVVDPTSSVHPAEPVRGDGLLSS